MTKFHEGQEVEVWCFPDGEWERATIIGVPGDKNKLLVRFPDGSRAVFEADHIRLPQ